MNNLILNLDAQLWVFDSTPNSPKFAIENISSKKVRKVLALLPFVLYLVTSGKVAADPFTVYKDGKKLNNFFETNEIIPAESASVAVATVPPAIICAIT